MTASDRLQPGQAQAARLALMRGETPASWSNDRVTERGRLAVESAVWALQQAQDRRQLGMGPISTVTAAVSILAALPGGGEG